MAPVCRLLGCIQKDVLWENVACNSEYSHGNITISLTTDVVSVHQVLVLLYLFAQCLDVAIELISQYNAEKLHWVFEILCKTRTRAKRHRLPHNINPDLVGCLVLCCIIFKYNA